MYSNKFSVIAINIVLVFSLVLLFIFIGAEILVRKRQVAERYPVSIPTESTSAQERVNVFTVDENTNWREMKGEQYPYMFLAPETLSLVRLADNPYDIYAISWNNINPNSNVLIGVDNLHNNEHFKEFIHQPKVEYVKNWWKQFGGLIGVKSITTFTNSNGLKGYKVKYIGSEGPVEFDDVFFEVESEPHIVIHLSNIVLDNTVFDRIVDSLSWAQEQ